MRRKNSALKYAFCVTVAVLFSASDTAASPVGQGIELKCNFTTATYGIDSKPIADSARTQIPFIDIERFLRDQLIPNIEVMYEKGSIGLPDDHFAAMRDQLKPAYPFLFEGNVTGWNEFLSNLS